MVPDILAASALEILEHLDVLADMAGSELCDVHGLAVLRASLNEALLDLQELAVAIELALDVVLVEGVAGFFLLQLLDHRRVLLVGLRRGAGGAPQEKKKKDEKLPENSKKNLDKKLDHALEETFPTSDPISVKITK